MKQYLKMFASVATLLVIVMPGTLTTTLWTDTDSSLQDVFHGPVPPRFVDEDVRGTDAILEPTDQLPVTTDTLDQDGPCQPCQAHDPTSALVVSGSEEQSLTAGDDELADCEWSMNGPAAPLCIRDHAMAYDSARGVTVLFGGDGGIRLDDTWEWDGTVWTRRSPAHSPTARDGHAMAYDSARGVIVLFGGWGSSGRLNDTWEWDGTDWTVRSPEDKPTARYGHAMAYDSARGVTVLFGGTDGSGIEGNRNDTWEWDGTDWTERSPADKPGSNSFEPAMAYDSARGMTVLFHYGTTWEWDGTNWNVRSPTNRPNIFSGHAMAYDSARGVTVLFGGTLREYIPPYPDHSSATWEWDGTDWTRRSPENRPSGRISHAMAYDSARGVTVLFGGYSYEGPRYRDTWEWDGINWTRRFLANRPWERSNHAMAYDSTREVIVLFGGYCQSGYEVLYYDTWEMVGTEWTERFSANEPAARSDHAMAYDSAREVTVLFGGSDGTDTLNDTWEWDGTEWTEHSPANKPTARFDHVMAYDSTREVTVLFGGSDGTDSLNDTWEWDGTDWTQRFPANEPTPFRSPALAFDSGRGVTVLFGYGSSGNETWEWDGTGWTQRFPANKPPFVIDPALAYDSTRGVTILFAWDETWEWDGIDWIERFPTNKPSLRSDHAIAYDSAREVTVLFGGSTLSCWLNDTWEYSALPLKQGRVYLPLVLRNLP